MGGRKKFTYEFVKSIFESRGCTLLSTDYPGDRVKLRYIAQCGHERDSSFNNFYRGKGNLCPDCRFKQNGHRRQLGFEVIKNYFESQGCTVTGSGFSKQTDKVEYIALCGHRNVIDYAHFSSGGGRVCSTCSKGIQYKLDYVREQFEERGCELLETEYVNCKTKMRYIAQCGHESSITFDALLNSERAALRCRKCHKHTYHDEPLDRNRTASKVWRKKVYERDNYECRVCHKHGGDLNAHHLFAYDANADKRFSVENGVTLCPQCHTKFHSRYGFGGNTPEQFYEWIEGNTEVRAESKDSVTP